MGSQAGRRKVTASPTSSSAPSPTPLRLKLSIRPLSQTQLSPKSSMPPPLPSSSSSSAMRKGQARKKGPSQRPNYATIYSDSESDLTPDEDVDMAIAEAAASAQASAPQKRKIGRPRNSDKGKERATVPKAHSNAASKSQESKSVKGKEKAVDKVTITGPAGRDRKRSIKNDQAERRRSRDAKFDTDTGNYGASSSKRKLDDNDNDATSSYGDDESDRDMAVEPQAVFSGFGDETEDEGHVLPAAFAGHEIEDLAYGSGYYDYDVEREALSGWWGEEEDEDETEDEAMLIAKLSGSEAEQDSQSSAAESQSDESTSSEESEEEGDVDEYGYPMPLSTNPDAPAEDAPLVLMENWDGQFVLVQPRAERSSKKRRNSKGSKGSKGSRTNGSVAGSTIAPSEQQDQEMALVMDPDAVGHEFDSYSSSEWSGVSDEDDGGDTTDSMAEEDMPMLDSPAMDDLIQQQIGLPTPPEGWYGQDMEMMANGVDMGDGMDIGMDMGMDIGMDMNVDLGLADLTGMDGMEGMEGMNQGAPAIVITDTSIPETPALSTTSDGTPNMSYPLPGPPMPPLDFPAPPLPIQYPTSIVTPGASASAPVSPIPPAPLPMDANMPSLAPVPMMGTFLPRSSDPAQHAVIDGSGTSTVSPFTHRRRSRKQRAGSMSSMGGRSARSTTAGMGTPGPGPEERKRKTKSQSIGANGDPFSPALSSRSKSANSVSSAAKAKALLAKKARYSSIPGHPRYLAAQREAIEAEERERTPSDDGLPLPGMQMGMGMGMGIGRNMSMDMGMEMDIDMDMDMQFDLDDMLDTGMFAPSFDEHGNALPGQNDMMDIGMEGMDDAATAEHMRHMIRFDRVPVSTYMQRNFAAGAGKGHHVAAVGNGHGHGADHADHQSPTRRPGHRGSNAGIDLQQQRSAAAQNVTLTPAQDRFAISPLFGPEKEEERRGRVPAMRL